jgi:hypothetical protein
MDAENLAAAHAIERLEDDITLFVDEMLELMDISRDQCGGGELIEFTNCDFLGVIP